MVSNFEKILRCLINKEKIMKTFIFALTLLSSISAFTCDQDRICSGDRVQFDGNNSGTAVEVFNNGKVKIKDDSTEYKYRDISQVGKGHRCVGRICRKNRVQFDGNNSGTAVEVFDNGKVKIKDNSSEYKYRDISQVGKAYNCVESLCSRDRVQFDGNNSGTAVEVFDNGKVKIKDNSSEYKYRDMYQLGYEVTCSVGLKKQTCKCRNLNEDNEDYQAEPSTTLVIEFYPKDSNYSEVYRNKLN